MMLMMGFLDWLTEEMCVKIIYFWIGLIGLSVLLTVIGLWTAARNENERSKRDKAELEAARKNQIKEAEELEWRQEEESRKKAAETKAWIEEHPYSWREKHEDPVRLSDRELVWAKRYIYKVHYDSDRLEEVTAEVEKRARQERLIEAMDDIRRKLVD